MENKKIKLSEDYLNDCIDNGKGRDSVAEPVEIVKIHSMEDQSEPIKVQLTETELELEIELNEKQIECIADDIANYSFWPWLMKYRVLGMRLLHKILKIPLDSNVKDELEFLPRLKQGFEDLKRRDRLGQGFTTFSDAVNLIQKSSNIIVLTGAGVSVSCGIPDFRSANGIYSRLSEFQLSDPQEMFDLEYFKFRPETFYQFASEIYPSNFKPSPSHRFIKMLEDRKKLLRNYTQNIDTLENQAGIKNVVQCHGSFATASCITCKYRVDGKAIENEIFSKTVPVCPKCPENVDYPFLKPDIVFFGENLPERFHESWKADAPAVDLLIVMGSSLKVAPVANLRDRIGKNIPQILINMESLPHMHNFDIHLLGYSDNVTMALAQQLGWTGDTDNTVNVEYRSGLLPWHWLFEGAIEKPVESDSESVEETGSELTKDSNTEDEGSQAGLVDDGEQGLQNKEFFVVSSPRRDNNIN